MADIKQLRLEIATLENELKCLEKSINSLNEQIRNESTKYNSNQKTNQELAKRIDGLEQSLKAEQAKYDKLFDKFLNLSGDLEAAEKQYHNNINNQKTK
jgi:chromosome segregation ATPase